MSVEERIRKLAEEVIACRDDGETAVLPEDLQDAIRQPVILLRVKRGAIPLGLHGERLNQCALPQERQRCLKRISPMPVRSVIHKKLRLVVTTEEGCVTFADMRANQDRLLGDPEFDPEFNQLSDATRATDTDLSTDNTRTLFKRKVFSTAARRAVVAPSAFAYGMARMLETYVELSRNGPIVAVFRDRASALKWLGVSDDILET